MARGLRCPRCGRFTYHQYNGSVHRCSNCGYDLTECPQCNKIVLPTDVCMNCGTKLKEFPLI